MNKLSGASLLALIVSTSASFACTAVSTDITDCGAGGVMVTPGLNMSNGGASSFSIKDTTQGTDQKTWDFETDGGSLNFRAINDPYTNSVNWLKVYRSGLNPTGISAFFPLTDVTNLASATAGLDASQSYIWSNSANLGNTTYAAGDNRILALTIDPANGNPTLRASNNSKLEVLGGGLYVPVDRSATSSSGSVAVVSNDPNQSVDGIVGPGILTNTLSAIVHNTNSSSTLTGVNGIGVFGLNDAAGTGGLGIGGGNNMVGLYSNITCRVNLSRCWGANPMVNILSTATNSSSEGTEIDVNNDSSSSSGSGLSITGASSNSGNATTGFSALEINLMDRASGNSPRAKWRFGTYYQPGSTSAAALDIGAVNADGTGASMPIQFDSGSTFHATLNVTATGQLHFNNGAHDCLMTPATGTVSFVCN